MRVKEYLSARAVEFDSVDVLAGEQGMADLRELGARSVPVVSKGDDFVYAQRLDDVDGLLGLVPLDRERLGAAELAERLDRVLAAAQRFLRQIPPERMHDELPNRPRSYRQLGHHIFVVADAFLDACDGAPLSYDALAAVPPADLSTGDDLAGFGDGVRARLKAWHATGGSDDPARAVATYYGKTPLHEVLERTTWHAAQHVRQLLLILEILEIAPDRPLGPADFAGLPMPEAVWDG